VPREPHPARQLDLEQMHSSVTDSDQNGGIQFGGDVRGIGRRPDHIEGVSSELGRTLVVAQGRVGQGAVAVFVFVEDV